MTVEVEVNGIKAVTTCERKNAERVARALVDRILNRSEQEIET